MKTLRCTCAALLAACALPLAAAGAPVRPAEALDVVAAIPRDLPPEYSTDKSGRPAGLAAEVLREVATEANLRLSYVTVDDLEAAQALVRAGRADLVPLVPRGAAPPEGLAFSPLLATFPIAVFLRAGDTDIRQPSDLRGHKVGLVKHLGALSPPSGLQGAEAVSVGDARQALFELLAGRLDAVVIPEPYLWNLALEAGVAERIRVLADPMGEAQFAMALRADHPLLAQRLDPAVRRFVGGPRLRQIYLRWSAGPGERWADPKLLAAAGAALGVVVLIMAAWRFFSLQRLNRDLSRAVEERRQAQAAEQRLAEILAATPDVVAISDTEGRVLYLNPAGRRILGLGSDDPLRDMHASRHYTPQAFKRMESVALPAALRDGLWTGESALMGRDGREIPVLQVLIAHKSDEGKVRFLSSVMRDISERHAMERALAAESERFYSVLEGLPAFVYVQDRNRRITYANRFFKERFGDPAGRLCSEVLPCTGEACDRCPSRRISGARAPGVREWTDAGSGRSYQVHDHPVPGRDGSVLALQMGIDVTDRRRSEAELAAAKDRLALALEASSLALWDADVARGEVFLDEGWARMMGGEPKPTVTTIARLMEQAHPDDRAYVLRMAVQAIHARVPEYRAEHRMRTKSGTWKWIQSHGRVVSRDERGFALRMTGTNADITSRRQMEEALRQSEEKFAKAFNQSPDVIVLSTLDEGRYLEVNDAFERLSGYSRAETIGRTATELGIWVDPADRTRVVQRMLDEGRIANHEVRLRRKSGELLTGLMSADVAVIQGRRCMLAVVRDISERKRAEERLMESKQHLDHLAHHDALTGLPNRLLFMDRLKHGIAKAQRHEQTLALMFVDLDDFKDLNDAYGHDFGDQVLAAVAARLAGSVRKSDTVSRLGGDEFTLVMEDVEDVQSVLTLAQKVIELVSQPMEIEGRRVRVGASIGISLYPSDATTADALVRLADLAMYRAKQAGRNCFQFYRMEGLPPGLRAVGGASSRSGQ